MGHAVLVEDDEDLARVVARLIVASGHSVAVASSLAAARELLAMQQPDLLLLDIRLPDGSGLDLLEEAPLVADAEVVLMTGHASVETSIKALRLGVSDYLIKPVNPPQLKAVLSRFMRPSQIRAEVTTLAQEWRASGRFGELIGASEVMQAVYHQIARVAATSVTVFVHGESGTGKELVARAVHELSRRRSEPFLAINCGALSPQLIESEIFGHERGSFTGAERQHQGFFERAHGGTLFLDEVTEMPAALQVKLLRVLESATFMRVGSTQVLRTDVRIIAATNRDAHLAVRQGSLREDLLYRLNVFPITLPPLRQRNGDVSLLARSFLQELGQREGAPKEFTPGALARLQAYRWPGNVRELRNAVQRAWVMAAGRWVDEEWLPIGSDVPVAAFPGSDAGLRSMDAPHGAASGVAAPWSPAPAGDTPRDLHVRMGTPLADIERQVILATFEHCDRHKERTAAALGISMKTLYNRLKEYQSRPTPASGPATTPDGNVACPPTLSSQFDRSDP